DGRGAGGRGQHERDCERAQEAHRDVPSDVRTDANGFSMVIVRSPRALHAAMPRSRGAAPARGRVGAGPRKPFAPATWAGDLTRRERPGPSGRPATPSLLRPAPAC